jgi:hypothetical protein
MRHPIVLYTLIHRRLVHAAACRMLQQICLPSLSDTRHTDCKVYNILQ